MKIEIDARPSKSSNNLAEQKPVFIIRLYPETNEEMAKLEWAKDIRYEPVNYLRNCAGDKLHYAIVFESWVEREEELKMAERKLEQERALHNET